MIQVFDLTTFAHPRHKRATLLGAAALLALACASPAQADEAVDAVAIAEAEEVVVTARHREETAQSVPASLSVVGGEFLEKTNTTNFPQLVKYVPSIQFSFFNPRNSSINIRGLGNASGIASDGLEPGVGFYVDQVYFARPATTTFDLIDVERVEVLHGPQGTLFGKNTTAGVVSITTESPTFEPHANGELSVGNYGYVAAKGSVSGPLVGDVLAGRLTLSTSRRDGLVTNDFDGNEVNGTRNFTARGQLLYVPTEALRVRLIADYSRQNANCCYQTLAGIISPPNGKNFVAITQALGYTPRVDPFERHVNANSPVYARQETGGLSVQADWSTPKVVLTSVTAWRFWNWWPWNDVDYTPLSVMTAANLRDYENQFSQEFRIASAGSNRLDYVAGVYFFREQIKAVGLQRYGDAAASFLLGPSVPGIVTDGYGLTSTASNNTISAAAFGQATLHLDDRWSLTGGLRYTYDDKRGRFDQLVGGGAPLTGPLASLAALRLALAAPVAYNEKLDDSHVSGQINLSYKASEDLLAYATAARGYKSGGINLTQLPPGASSVIDAEKIDSFEIGLKSRLFDRRVTLNAAAYLQRDKNYQGTVVVTGTTRSYLANIPKVETKGVEVDFRAEPNERLSIYAAAAYVDAQYKSFPDAPCPIEATTPTCSLTGRPLAGVPRWTVSAGVEYRHPVSLGSGQADAYVAVDDTFRSSIFAANTNSVHSRLPSLNLIDARIGLRDADGRWDAFVWGRNILDKEYFVSRGPGLGNTGAIFGTLGDPATFGATVRVRY